MTKLQLAQKRNYFKFVLSGIPKPIDRGVLTPQEDELWGNIISIRKELIDKFDENSQKQGLNVNKDGRNNQKSSILL